MVSDSGFAGGNVMDWKWRAALEQSWFQDVDYLCVVTVKTLSGQLYQRQGMLSLRGGQASLHVLEGERLKAGPALDTSRVTQALEVSGTDTGTPLTLVREGASQSVTVITHDGTDGQVTSTEGALTFRTGDVFSGNEKEQMRLTPDGRVGIGTDKPQATLDVAGSIRTTGGIQFPDGTVQTTALTARKATSGDPFPNATGTGSQDKIAKWIDSIGTLGDSNVIELGGNVGIGTLTPTQPLDVAGQIVTSGSQTLTTANKGVIEVTNTITNNAVSISAVRARNTFNGNGNPIGFDVVPLFAPSANINLARGMVVGGFLSPPSGVTITSAYGANAVLRYGDVSGAVTTGTTFLVDTPIVDGALKPTTQYGLRISNQGISGTNTSYGLYVEAQSGSTNNYSAIFSGGSVGIGTSTPAAMLDVAGNINTSTQYNIGGSRVFSIAGTSNTFVGSGSGNANTTGQNNAFFGNSTGAANTTGSNNSFFGKSAGAANTIGTGNSFFGRNAGLNNTTAAFNSFFGESAGANNTTGGDNSFFGDFAGSANTTGESNSFFGRGAGQNNTTGSSNSFFGVYAGVQNTTGGSNSFFGLSAGFHNTTGGSNSFFGPTAGEQNTTGSSNSFFGNSAGTVNTTGISNSFFGGFAGHVNTTGGSNSFFGGNAGQDNSTGANNSFFGAGAGLANTTASSNSFFGNASGFHNTTGSSNSFFGQNAGQANTTAGSNSFFGMCAGNGNTTGASNSFFGKSAGAVNTTASHNSFFGEPPLPDTAANTTGANNSFFGETAGAANTTGSFNSFFGQSAGDLNTTGANNSFFGWNAGAANTTATGNSFFGTSAGKENTTGGTNAFFGREAGHV